MSEAALNLSKAEPKKSRRDEEKEARKMRSKEHTKDDADVATKPASESKPGKESAASEPKPGKENSALEANNHSSSKTLPAGGTDFLKDVSSGVKSEKTDGYHHAAEYHESAPGPAMHLPPLHPTAIPGLPGYGHLGYGLFPGLHPAPRPEEALAGCEDVEILYDSGEPVIEVECGENKAFLYINKLCQGSKGPSIRLNSEMLTPNEFQFISGRETAKDWKRSIRHKGKSLKTLMAKGILQVHPPICDCPGCRISSPVAAMLQNRGRLVDKRGGPVSARRREGNQSDDGENAGEADEEQGPSSGKKSNLSSIISHLYCSASSASGGSGTAGDRVAASSPNGSSSGETNGLEGLGLRGVQGRKRGRGRAGSAERREAVGHTKRRRSGSPPRDDSPPTHGEDTSAAAYLSSDYRQRLLSALNNEQGTYEEQQQRIYQLANSVEPDRGAQENSGPKENGVCSRRSSPGSPAAGDGPDRGHSPNPARHSPHKPPLPPHMDPGALPREYLENGGHFFSPHTPHIALGAHLRPPFLGFPHLLSPAHLGYTFLRPGETTPQELLARQNDLLRKRYADQMNTEILLRQQEAFRRYASLSREQQRRLAGEPLSAVPGVLPPDPHLMHPGYAADSPLLYPSEQARRNAMLVLRHAPEVSLPQELSPSHSRERPSPPAKPHDAPSHTESDSSERENVTKDDRETETPEEGPTVNGDVQQDAVPRRPDSPSESKDSEMESQPERPSSRDSNVSSNNNDCTCRGVACCRDNNIREPEETIASWTVDDVFQFIKSLSGCSEYAQAFKDQAIDGETLPMLHEELLQNQLGMKLGPALKIRAQVAKRQGRCSICFHCLHCHKGQNSVTSEDPPQSPSPAASCS